MKNSPNLPNQNKKSKFSTALGLVELAVRKSSLARQSVLHTKSVVLINIENSGFAINDIKICEGQIVTFQTNYKNYSEPIKILQVVHDGINYRPVPGGYQVTLTPNQNKYSIQFNMSNEYKFAQFGVECEACTIHVAPRKYILSELLDGGFKTKNIVSDIGNTVIWEWQNCFHEQLMFEVQFDYTIGTYVKVENSEQGKKAKNGKFIRQFNHAGIFYFVSYISNTINHVCSVNIRPRYREHLITVVDGSFNKSAITIETGDRVWWKWDGLMNQNKHNIYEINLPCLNHPTDASFAMKMDGFHWINPSIAGLVSQTFNHSGVYYFSDYNDECAADYIGTIIVKNSCSNYYFNVNNDGFEDMNVIIKNNDSIWFQWGHCTKRDINIKKIDTCVYEDSMNDENKIITDQKEIQEYKISNLQFDCKYNMINFTNVGLVNLSIDNHEQTKSNVSVIVKECSRAWRRVGLLNILRAMGCAFDLSYKNIMGSIHPQSISKLALFLLIKIFKKEHKIVLNDYGISPQVLSVYEGDRILWEWLNYGKSHNIVQVNHCGERIVDGFCSGSPIEPPSAFSCLMEDTGVIYYREYKHLYFDKKIISDRNPKIIGAIVVNKFPKVNVVNVKDNKPETNPILINMGDMVVWNFFEYKMYDLKKFHSDLPLTKLPTKRSCIGKIFNQEGTHNFEIIDECNISNNKTVEDPTDHISSVLVGRNDCHTLIRIVSKKFIPSHVTILKKHCVRWIWSGSNDYHNIIHDSFIERVNGDMKTCPKFTSGSSSLNGNFIHTFTDTDVYKIISSGAPNSVCIVNVIKKPEYASPPQFLSELTGGRIVKGTEVYLGSKDQEANIYYTIDGSIPRSSDSNLYNKKNGIILKTIGIIFIRACSYEIGKLPSEITTSNGFIVMNKNEMNLSRDISELSLIDLWRSYEPIIVCNFVPPNNVELLIKEPSEHIIKLLRGYTVIINDINYGGLHSYSERNLLLNGFTATRNYKIYIECFSTQKNFRSYNSNIQYLKMPSKFNNGKPIASIGLEAETDATLVMWGNLKDSSISGYKVFVNDYCCGQMIQCDDDKVYGMVIDELDDGSYTVKVCAVKTVIRNVLPVSQTEKYIHDTSAPKIQMVDESMDIPPLMEMNVLTTYKLNNDRTEIHINWTVIPKSESGNVAYSVVSVIGTTFSNKINSDSKERYDNNNFLHKWKTDSFDIVINGLCFDESYKYFVTIFINSNFNEKKDKSVTSKTIPFKTHDLKILNSVLTIRIISIGIKTVVIDWSDQLQTSDVKLQKILSTGNIQLKLNDKVVDSCLNDNYNEVNLVEGQFNNVQISVQNEQEIVESNVLRIYCPNQPQKPNLLLDSKNRNCRAVSWTKSNCNYENNNLIRILKYSIYLNNQLKSEIEPNKINDETGYQYNIYDDGQYECKLICINGKNLAIDKIKHDHPDAYNEKVNDYCCLNQSSNTVHVENKFFEVSKIDQKSDIANISIDHVSKNGIKISWTTPMLKNNFKGYQVMVNNSFYGSIIPNDETSITVKNVPIGSTFLFKVLVLMDTISEDTHQKNVIFCENQYWKYISAVNVSLQYIGLLYPIKDVTPSFLSSTTVYITWNIHTNVENPQHYVAPSIYKVILKKIGVSNNIEHSDEIEEPKCYTVNENWVYINDLDSETIYEVTISPITSQEWTYFMKDTDQSRMDQYKNQKVELCGDYSTLKVALKTEPQPPKDIKIHGSSVDSVKVCWNSPVDTSNLIGLRVDARTLHSNNEHFSLMVGPTEQEVELKNLIPETQYEIRVTGIFIDYFLTTRKILSSHIINEFSNGSKNIHKISSEAMDNAFFVDEYLPHSKFLPYEQTFWTTYESGAPNNLKIVKTEDHTIKIEWNKIEAIYAYKISSLTVHWSKFTCSEFQGSARSSYPTNSGENFSVDSLTSSKSKISEMTDFDEFSNKAFEYETNLNVDSNACVLKGLEMGQIYKIMLSTTISKRTKHRTNNVNTEEHKPERHVSDIIMAQTSVSCQKPKTWLSAYSSNSITIEWQKPIMCRMISDDNLKSISNEKKKCINLKLVGYRIDINNKPHAQLNNRSLKCIITKCKPSQEYNITLVVITKLKNNMIDQFQNAMSECYASPILIKIPSEDTSIFRSISSDYRVMSLSKSQKKQKEQNYGYMDVKWQIFPQYSALKYEISISGGIEGRLVRPITKSVSANSRVVTLPVPRMQTIFDIKIKAIQTSLYEKPPNMTLTSQLIKQMSLGSPDAPILFLDRIIHENIILNWVEPLLYGVPVSHYQVTVNGICAELNISPRKTLLMLPYVADKSYDISLVAFTGIEGIPESMKSNVVKIYGEAAYDLRSNSAISTLKNVNDVSLKKSAFASRSKMSSMIKSKNNSQFCDLTTVNENMSLKSIGNPNLRLSKSQNLDRVRLQSLLSKKTIIQSDFGNSLSKSRSTLKYKLDNVQLELCVESITSDHIKLGWKLNKTINNNIICAYRLYINGKLADIIPAIQTNYKIHNPKPLSKYEIKLELLPKNDINNSIFSKTISISLPNSLNPVLYEIASSKNGTLILGWNNITENLTKKEINDFSHFEIKCTTTHGNYKKFIFGPIDVKKNSIEIENLNLNETYTCYLRIYYKNQDHPINSNKILVRPSNLPSTPVLHVSVRHLKERLSRNRLAANLINERDLLMTLLDQNSCDANSTTERLRLVEFTLYNCLYSILKYSGKFWVELSWYAPNISKKYKILGFKILKNGAKINTNLLLPNKTMAIVGIDTEKPIELLNVVAKYISTENNEEVAILSNDVTIVTSHFKPFIYYNHFNQNGYKSYLNLLHQEKSNAIKDKSNPGIIKFEYNAKLPNINNQTIYDFNNGVNLCLEKILTNKVTIILFWSANNIYSHECVKWLSKCSAACQNHNYICICTPSNKIKNVSNAQSFLSSLHVVEPIYTTFCFDKNRALSKSFDIAGVPTILVYSENKIKWKCRYYAHDYSTFDSYIRFLINNDTITEENPWKMNNENIKIKECNQILIDEINTINNRNKRKRTFK
ncbi:hypothetical protein A3Q56_02948 [Intoshia linei]|uniref:Fibronectin type-III domain-containing protein n=1 Tax=Intoshia linei TaxID=1819745 RepID=A0A177B7C6_9BILA|nr:hypothetical protein A3Q56_02948 [Intoshia linei]